MTDSQNSKLMYVCKVLNQVENEIFVKYDVCDESFPYPDLLHTIAKLHSAVITLFNLFSELRYLGEDNKGENP